MISYRFYVKIWMNLGFWNWLFVLFLKHVGHLHCTWRIFILHVARFFTRTNYFSLILQVFNLSYLYSNYLALFFSGYVLIRSPTGWTVTTELAILSIHIISSWYSFWWLELLCFLVNCYAFKEIWYSSGSCIEDQWWPWTDGTFGAISHLGPSRW